MPIYEYQCKYCDHQLEALQKISDEPLAECPSCGKLELSKLVSAASFRLKGSGWYETDFKTGKKKQLADTDSNSSSPTNASKQNDKSTKAADVKSTSGATKTESRSK